MIASGRNPRLHTVLEDGDERVGVVGVEPDAGRGVQPTHHAVVQSLKEVRLPVRDQHQAESAAADEVVEHAGVGVAVGHQVVGPPSPKKYRVDRRQSGRNDHLHERRLRIER